MELKDVFNAWAHKAPEKYIRNQWLLSKWEVFDGIEWSKEKTDIIFSTIEDRLKLNPHCDLLDVGCGGGWILNELSSKVHRAYGADLSLAMLRAAQQFIKADRLVCGEMGRLPYASEEFDAVLCYFVFINVQDDRYLERAVLEMLRVLKKGGRLLIGQLPDVNGSSAYDAAKADYSRFYDRDIRSGANTARVNAPPLRLFDKHQWQLFFDKNKIEYQILPSFNPLYYPGQPKLVNWRFDVLIHKG